MSGLANIWTKTFAVGIEEIDEDHQRLFQCLDAVMLSLNTSQSQAQSLAALATLDLYAQTHFRVEECLMRLFAYPELDAHKQEHAAFAQKLDELRAKLAEEDVSKQMAAFLTNWLLNHIKGSDSRYVAFFKNRANQDAVLNKIA